MRQTLVRLYIGISILDACFLSGTFFIWGKIREIKVHTMLSTVASVDATKASQSAQKKESSVVSSPLTTPSTTSVSSGVILDHAPDALPARINLPVPFTSQAPEKNWDEPWQDACEEAAVLMIDAYYKKYGVSPLFAKDELLRMVAWEEKKGWGYSIPMTSVVELAKYVIGSREYTVIENPTALDIKRAIAAGHPVLAVADGKVLPNPHFRSGGPVYHALVVRGYTEDSFITNDPGTQFGENFIYTYDALLGSIHDWNDGDVPHGKKVVLVVGQ